LKKITVIT